MAMGEAPSSLESLDRRSFLCMADLPARKLHCLTGAVKAKCQSYPAYADKTPVRRWTDKQCLITSWLIHYAVVFSPRKW